MNMKRILSVMLTLMMMLSLCCSGTVRAADPSISLSRSTITIAKGKAVTLTAEVSGVSSPKITWSTSDKTICTVSGTGKVSALKNGSATITAKVKNTDLSASCKVYVGSRVTSITLGDSEITLKKGDTYSISPKFSPSDATNKNVSYGTSNKAVAAVSAKGVVTAKSNGTAKITVKATDGSGAKAVITVKVSSKGGSSAKSDSAKDEPKSDKKEKTSNSAAAKFIKNMKIGWNLGNSLDSIGSNETAWGNPKTTRKMIDDIKAAGFNTVRIPTTWHKHVDSTGKIDESWMNRVQEVVDYAYDQGMYVILNSHHDNSYYDVGGCSKSEAKLKESKDKMSYLWKQIATRFKSYNDHLIFETLNEPRWEGSAKEWSGGTAAEREVVYALNQTCLDAIRSTGGNNKSRYVMIPSYAATSSISLLKSMPIPDDSHIILSVHAYSPYNFAMNANGDKDFTDSHKKELTKFFEDLDTNFVSKGVPVVIGEFGCTNKNNLDARCEWSEYFVKEAKAHGIVCVWWDNNGFKVGAENFGIYNRNSGTWPFEDIVKALMRGVK